MNGKPQQSSERASRSMKLSEQPKKLSVLTKRPAPEYNRHPRSNKLALETARTANERLLEARAQLSAAKSKLEASAETDDETALTELADLVVDAENELAEATTAFKAAISAGKAVITASKSVSAKVFLSAVIEKVDHGLLSKTTHVWVFGVGSLMADSALIEARGINIVAGQALSVRLEKSSFAIQDRVAEVRSWREGEGVAVPTATASTKS